MRRREGGFVTLLSIMIIGAITAAIMTTVVLVGIGATKNSLTDNSDRQALALADACAETALVLIQATTSYTSASAVTVSPLGAGSCTHQVTASGPNGKIIDASGTVGTVTRRIKVLLSATSPSLTVTSWQEVAAF